MYQGKNPLPLSVTLNRAKVIARMSEAFGNHCLPLELMIRSFVLGGLNERIPGPCLRIYEQNLHQCISPNKVIKRRSKISLSIGKITITLLSTRFAIPQQSYSIQSRLCFPETGSDLPRPKSKQFYMCLFYKVDWSRSCNLIEPFLGRASSISNRNPTSTNASVTE